MGVSVSFKQTDRYLCQPRREVLLMSKETDSDREFYVLPLPGSRHRRARYFAPSSSLPGVVNVERVDKLDADLKGQMPFKTASWLPPWRQWCGCGARWPLAALLAAPGLDEKRVP